MADEGLYQDGNIYGYRCHPNRVWLDQCDEALAFVKIHPGTTALEVGAAIYPWGDTHEGYTLRNPAATRTAFARRRLDTLVDAGFVVREMDGWTCCYRAVGPPGPSS
jgi:hypothetical protein